jgi:hypothetical protein
MQSPPYDTYHPLSFPITQIELHKCVRLLNAIDGELEKFVKRWEHSAFLPEENVEKEAKGSGLVVHEADGAEFTEDLQDCKMLLSFTADLLKSSINKDIYSSVEVRIPDLPRGRKLISLTSYNTTSSSRYLIYTNQIKSNHSLSSSS